MKSPDIETDVLRSVSRSFYLSIRLLPASLRAPVAVAYLLARATDTIADTTTIAAKERSTLLERVAAAIQYGRIDSIADLPKRFAALQENAAERTLIEALPATFQMLAQLSDKGRAEVRLVLSRINEGQRLDVARFGDPSSTVALETVDELRRYTYLVAGSVGEFWTAICEARPGTAFARDTDEMRELGVRYGCGLQLINILRDAGSDLRAGRCYFPAEELARAHVNLESIFANRERFMVVHARWRAEAEAGIAAGIDYAVALQNRRVRIATALPALIGARTLALIRDAGTRVLDQKVKVSREEVRAMLTKLSATLASRRSIRALFDRLRR